jgi:hypothetical protein
MTTENSQNNAQRLLQALVDSKGKRQCFCSDVWKEPIEDSYFTFKTPSACGGCCKALAFLRSFEPNWHSVPYIRFIFDREYRVSFSALQAYAEGGEEALEKRKRDEQLKKAQEQILAELKRRAENAERAAEKIRKVCPSDVAPSSRLIQQLSKHPYANSVFVKSAEIAAWVGDNSWDTGAGMSYADVLYVCVNGGLTSMSFQWRDGRSESYDNPGNKINEVLGIEVGETEITVTAKNRYGEREITLSLPEPVAETDDAPELLPEEQVAFIADVQEQIAKTLEDKQKMRELKPQYLESRVPGIGYTSYRQPIMLWLQIDEKHGWAVYAFEEQIDARVSDRQFRFEVYAVQYGAAPACVYEAHGYESAGLPSVSCQELTPEGVVLRTSAGTVTHSYTRAS